MKNLIMTILSLCIPLAAAAQVELKMTASDAEASDEYGVAVAVSGDIAVVGSLRGGVDIPGTGSAYVYSRNQGGFDNWGQVAELSASDGVAGDSFGSAVDIDGDTIIVGASQAGSRGAAYLFFRNEGGAGAWGQIAKLEPSGDTASWFGKSVALSGETAVIGSELDTTTAINAGAAYIFSFVPGGGIGNWVQTKKLLSSDSFTLHDRFGISVAIDGDLIVVGERDGEGVVNDCGAAYLFGRNTGGANAWGEIAKLTASDGLLANAFGEAVAVSGNRIAVGAPRREEAGVQSGAVYVFEQAKSLLGGGGETTESAKIVPPDGATYDLFGLSLAFQGSTLVCGAPSAASVQGIDSNGAVYVHARDQGGSGAWGIVARLVAADGDDNDEFGSSVAISGSDTLIGVHNDDDVAFNSGATYLYFTPSGGLFLDGFESGDFSAWSGISP